MPNNFFVTGRPGSGKSTVVWRTVEILKSHGLQVGGIVCPELRNERGVRVGFKMRDVATGEERMLAAIGHAGPSVGKYGVMVENVDFMAENSILGALKEADVVVVDEIAPMEIFSEKFRGAILLALDSPKPLLAAVHMKSQTGFIGQIKQRSDVRIWTISQENRDRIPGEIASAILEALRTKKAETRREHRS